MYEVVLSIDGYDEDFIVGSVKMVVDSSDARKAWARKIITDINRFNARLFNRYFTIVARHGGVVCSRYVDSESVCKRILQSRNFVELADKAFAKADCTRLWNEIREEKLDVQVDCTLSPEEREKLFDRYPWTEHDLKSNFIIVCDKKIAVGKLFNFASGGFLMNGMTDILNKNLVKKVNYDKVFGAECFQ